MLYQYLAFGIPIVSEIALPALLPYQEGMSRELPVQVKLGMVPERLCGAVVYDDNRARFNSSEMRYHVPQKIKFYITNGNSIIVEPESSDITTSLIYFYANALAAILYQRNKIPFHVSGVFVAENKVALFAAPSGTGKSTLAVQLQELGFKPFTDDAAVLYFENGKCYAQASYPMMRLWQNSLDTQSLLQEADKQKLYDDGEWDKYGFLFHENFPVRPAEVQQIIFLQKEGVEIETKPIKSIDAFKALAENVYRCHWIPAMGKSKEQFLLISNILSKVPISLITRPKYADSIKKYSLTIKEILQSKNL